MTSRRLPPSVPLSLSPAERGTRPRSLPSPYIVACAPPPSCLKWPYPIRIRRCTAGRAIERALSQGPLCPTNTTEGGRGEYVTYAACVFLCLPKRETEQRERAAFDVVKSEAAAVVVVAVVLNEEASPSSSSYPLPTFKTACAVNKAQGPLLLGASKPLAARSVRGASVENEHAQNHRCWRWHQL